MNDSQKKKLLKAKTLAKQETEEVELGYFSDEQIKAIHSDIATIKSALAEALTYERDDLIESQKESLERIDATLKEFASRLQDSLDQHETKSVTIVTPELGQAVKQLTLIANRKVEPQKEVAFPGWLASDKGLKEITKALDSLSKAVNIKPGQLPSDFVPMRRVVKVGNKLLYDDSFYTGGGGGSNTPIKNGAMPVVNPDGSNIGGSGAVTNDGTFATPARQDTGNTSLAGIKTQTDKLTFTGNRLQVEASVVVESVEIGTVDQGTGGSSAWKVDGSAATQPVSAVSLPLPTGAATSGNQTTELTRLGDVTESAPATDTASSGLNGRLQRIAQRLTSLITALGSPFQAGGSIGNTAFGVNNGSGASAVNIQDGGNSITVDGAVSITPSGTQDENLKQVNGATVNIGTGAASTGTQRVTTSTDSTIGTVSTITNVVHVDDNSGSLTVDNAGTFAVQSTIGASATNIAKAEDVASADSDVGVPAMAIRKATPANTSGTDGDYEMLQVSAGRLWVDASGKTLTVDGSGVTQPVSGTITALPSGTQDDNIKQVNGAAVNVGTGTASTGTQRVAVSSDSFPASQAVTGTFFQATQPVSLATNTPTLQSGSTTTVTQATGTNLHTVVDSGTITANAGTNLNTSALALDATLTNATQKTKLVDTGGTNVASIDSTGALAIQSGGSTGSTVPTRAVQVGGTDGTNLRAIKVSAAGVVSVDGSATTQPVSGTVAATQSGVWTVQPGNTANTTAWKVDGSAVTQPVSLASTTITGTVATLETRPASEASTNLTNSTSNQTALASNASRRMATFYNDDTLSTGASVYLKCGATASATSFKIKIAPGGYFELPQPTYTGIIDVLATANTGTLRVTETT